MSAFDPAPKYLFIVSVLLPKPSPRSRFRARYVWSVLATNGYNAMVCAKEQAPEMDRPGCDWSYRLAETGICYHGCSNAR